MRNIKNIKDSIIKVLYPNILFKDESINKKDVYKNIIHQVRERNLICAIFIFFIQLFFFIKYINEGFYTIDAVHKYHMVAQIIFASSSVIAVVYYMLTIKKDFDVLNRIANIVYSFIILFAMFLWMVCSITHDPDAFSIAFIYMIIFVLVPRIYFIDTLLIYLSSIVGLIIVTEVIVPYAVETYEYYLICVAFLFISLYIRSNLIRTNVSIVNEKKLMKILEMQNSIDSLTGAFNRRALDNFLNDNFNNWKREEEYVALLMFDIDNFKEYNDTFSHIEGDECMKCVVDTIKNLCNDHMPHIFRYGGDEFATVIVGLDRLDVLNKALEILKSIKKLQYKTHIDGEYLSISIGCKMLSDIIESPVDFLSKADEELYQAKRSGKGCISFKKEIYK